MNSLVWSALGLGILGSLHCVGMCGPIALALPATRRSRTSLLLHRLAYNAGRIITYMILGIVVGMLGQLVAFAGWQQGLSLGTGLFILMTLALSFTLPKLVQRVRPNNLLLGIITRVRAFWGKLFAAPTLLSMLGIGLLNGLLPCGLLYVALAAAASTGAWGSGMIFMLLFGLGTIPALLAVSYAGQLLPSHLRAQAGRLIPMGAALMAIILILRGLSLGIPYLSPNLDSRTPDNPRTVKECCK